jgi:hypothetical protein
MTQANDNVTVLMGQITHFTESCHFRLDLCLLLVSC